MYCGKSLQKLEDGHCLVQLKDVIVYLAGQARSSRSLLCLTVHCLPLSALPILRAWRSWEEGATVDGWGCGGSGPLSAGSYSGERDWENIICTILSHGSLDPGPLPGDMLALSNLKKLPSFLGSWPHPPSSKLEWFSQHLQNSLTCASIITSLYFPLTKYICFFVGPLWVH